MNLYYYGARYYEPTLGRFTQTDALREAYPSWSPFHYCGNNPIGRIDPDGRTWAEASFAVRHPFAAAKAYSNSSLAKRMTFPAGSGQDPNAAHNNLYDAQRHALWGALNAQSIGSELALEIADAHEDYEGNPEDQKAMDMANGELGIQIGTDCPTCTPEQLLEKIAGHSDLQTELAPKKKEEKKAESKSGDKKKKDQPKPPDPPKNPLRKQTSEPTGE